MMKDVLFKYANLKIWEVEEFTTLEYVYPISTKDFNAINAGQFLSYGIPKKYLRRVGPFLTSTSPNSHIGPFLNAIDFLVPDGTIVLAAQSGKIIHITECFTEWGSEYKFYDKVNYITIDHENGEFSQYGHLLRNSVSGYGLSVGSYVAPGQAIGIVGKTGWTDRDHLHFGVFRKDTFCKENPFGFRSLKVKFMD